MTSACYNEGMSAKSKSGGTNMTTIVKLISVIALLTLVLAGPGAVTAEARRHLGDQAVTRLAQSDLFRAASRSIDEAQAWIGGEWMTRPLAPAIGQSLELARKPQSLVAGDRP